MVKDFKFFPWDQESVKTFYHYSIQHCTRDFSQQGKVRERNDRNGKR